VREIEEELGMKLAPESLAPAGFASGTRGPESADEPVVILLYTCRDWSGEPRCLEGEELGRFMPEDLAGLAMPPLDYPLAEQLVAGLRNKSL